MDPPAFTGRDRPVIVRARSEARNTHASATSRPWPAPAGSRSVSRRSTSSSGAPSVMSPTPVLSTAPRAARDGTRAARDGTRAGRDGTRAGRRGSVIGEETRSETYGEPVPAGRYGECTRRTPEGHPYTRDVGGNKRLNHDGRVQQGRTRVSACGGQGRAPSAGTAGQSRGLFCGACTTGAAFAAGTACGARTAGGTRTACGACSVCRAVVPVRVVVPPVRRGPRHPG